MRKCRNMLELRVRERAACGSRCGSVWCYMTWPLGANTRLGAALVLVPCKGRVVCAIAHRPSVSSSMKLSRLFVPVTPNHAKAGALVLVAVWLPPAGRALA